MAILQGAASLVGSGTIKTQEGGGPNIPSGVIAYYACEGNATDSVGPYSGTLSNVTTIAGNIGNALTTDNANGSSLVSLTTGIPGSSSWSFTGFFKWPLATFNSSFRTLFRSASSHHHVIVDSSNNLGVYVGGFASSSYNMAGLSSGWHGIGSVVNAGATRFYIDGAYVGTSAAAPTDSINYIGNYQGGGQNWGAFDEVRIYNRALSDGEVQGATGASGDGISILGPIYLWNENPFKGAGSLSCNAIVFDVGTYGKDKLTLTISTGGITELEYAIAISLADMQAGGTLDYKIYIDGNPLQHYLHSPHLQVPVAGIAALSGVGVLAVNATAVKGPVFASASLAGAGVLAVSAIHTVQGAALFFSAGTLTTPTIWSEFLFSGEVATLAGAGALAVNGTHTPLAAALFAGSGALATVANVTSVSHFRQAHYRFRTDTTTVDATPTWGSLEDA